jgi:uncharacterized protein (TIGR03437 family)
MKLKDVARITLPLIVVIVPMTLLPFSGQPPTGLTGGLGQGNCTQCHSGNAINSGAGSVTIEAANYTPGQPQTIRVRVAHPTQARWGFSLMARLKGGNQGQAGSFTAGANTAVQTQGGIQYISHNGAPRTDPGAGFTFEFQWTAPQDTGGVVFYAAGNAANGNGANSGDFIYTTSREISAIAPPVNRPSISPGGVITANQFGAAARFASGSWIEIYGQNFAPELRTWDGGFQGDNAPTALGDLSVTINGRAAPIAFANSGQINVQAPEDPATGPVQIIVRRGADQSDAFVLTKSAEAPALYAPSFLNLNNRQFVGAFFPNSTTFAGSFPGVAGIQSRVARPGDTLIFYGVGFGAVRPQGTGSIPVAGRIVRELNQTVKPVRFRFGQAEGAVSYSGLAPNFIGLYQFNVTVPQLAPGVYELEISLDSQNIGQRLFFEVGQ